MKQIITVAALGLIAGCATTGPEHLAQPLVNVSSEDGTGSEKTLQSGDFLLTMTVAPTSIVRIHKDAKLVTASADTFLLDEGEAFFATDTNRFGIVYCSFRNNHRSGVNGALGKLCLADADFDQRFDIVLEHKGSYPQDVDLFPYHETAIVEHLVKNPMDIPYSYVDVDPEYAFDMGLRLREVSGRANRKVASFSVMAKAVDDDQWRRIARDIRVDVTGEEEDLLPMVTASLDYSRETGLVAQVTEVAEVATTGIFRDPITTRIDFFVVPPNPVAPPAPR